LLKQIGKGGCGEVFLAKEVTKAESPFVALKLVKVIFNLFYII
jgi:hypothetical protein